MLVFTSFFFFFSSFFFVQRGDVDAEEEAAKVFMITHTVIDSQRHRHTVT